MPRLFHIAVDEPFGDNDCDAHDRDYVYSAWLTSDGLETLKRDSKGRMSYWLAGWYPSAEGLIARGGDDDSIWQKED